MLALNNKESCTIQGTNEHNYWWKFELLKRKNQLAPSKTWLFVSQDILKKLTAFNKLGCY